MLPIKLLFFICLQACEILDALFLFPIADPAIVPCLLVEDAATTVADPCLDVDVKAMAAACEGVTTVADPCLDADVEAMAAACEDVRVTVLLKFPTVSDAGLVRDILGLLTTDPLEAAVAGDGLVRKRMMLLFGVAVSPVFLGNGGVWEETCTLHAVLNWN